MSTTAPVLPATLRLGPAHLTVTDLDRSVGFYQDAIGLRQQSRDDGVAALGTGGEDLLVLHEDPQARPAGRHKWPLWPKVQFENRCPGPAPPAMIALRQLR